MKIWLLQCCGQSSFHYIYHENWTIPYSHCLTCWPECLRETKCLNTFIKFCETLLCEKQLKIKLWFIAGMDLNPGKSSCCYLCPDYVLHRQAIRNSQAPGDLCLFSCEVDREVKNEGEQAWCSFTDWICTEE